MDRYGPEIEWDLHERLGLDLEDWFAGRHEWAKLLRLVDQMPRDSHYQAALYDDPEMAPRLARLQEEAGERDMTLIGWTHERELLTGLIDSVRQLTSVLIGVNSKTGKGPKVPPSPRPRTATDRARSALDVEYAQNIVSLFRPRKDER